MSIYTGGGDSGETSLADGTRVSKSSDRVEAYGTLDEACAAVGLARSAASDPVLLDVLSFIQQRLFNCAAIMSRPDGDRGGATVTAADVTALEKAIDTFETQTGPFSRFIIGGATETAARLHFARTVIRRAERRVAGVSEGTAANAHVSAFLNRCSDAAFAAARYADTLEDAVEEAWDPNAAAPPT